MLNYSECSIDELTIEDEKSFRHVALYGDLTQVLRDPNFRFRVLPASMAGCPACRASAAT